jgi:hypothetical protein
MRAQQALTVLPYDLFLFSSLHVYFAARLGVDPGEYVHSCGTFHIYEDEVEIARRACETIPEEAPEGLFAQHALADIALLIDAEDGLRQAALSDDTRRIHEQASSLANRSLSSFTRWAAAALVAHALRHVGRAPSDLAERFALTDSEARFVGILENDGAADPHA